jgi:hypothetical protein
MAATTINIGANPEVRGSLKFEGANSIGPQITMTLTLVQLAPSAALNMIGDEYGLIEIQGEVLLVDGSFGTVEHPDDALASPVVDAYYVGTGAISWQPEGGTTYAPLGNCNSFEFEQQVERLDHWQHMSGIRSKDFSPIVQQGATCTLRLDEWTAQNLRLYFLGDAPAGP